MFVSSLKEAGKFDKEKQAEAFQKSKEMFLEIMDDTAIAALNEIYKDLDAWITSKIEQLCWETKQ